MYEIDINIYVVVKVAIMSIGFCRENAIVCTNHTLGIISSNIHCLNRIT